MTLLRDSVRRAKSAGAFTWWYLSRGGAAIQVNPVSSRLRSTLADAVAVQDALAQVSGVRVSLDDAAAVSELLAVSGMAQPVALSDAVAPADALAARLGLGLVDAAVLSEDLRLALTWTADLSDIATLSEQLFAVEEGDVSALADVATAVEALAVRLRVIGVLEDVATPTDVLRAGAFVSLDDTLVGMSDALVARVRILRGFADAALPSEALSHTHIQPRVWHAALADAAAALDTLGAGGMFSATLADAELPDARISAVHLSQPTTHTTDVAFGDPLGDPPVFGLARLPGAPALSVMLETSSAAVGSGLYVAYASGARGDVGAIIEGNPTAEILLQQLTLNWLRFGASGPLVVVNREGSGSMNAAFAADSAIVLANEFGDALILGEQGGAPNATHIPVESEGSGYLRFRGVSSDVTSYERFLRRLGGSRRLILAWYSSAGSLWPSLVLLPGLSERVEVGQSSQTVALDDAVAPNERLVADTEDVSTLHDDAAVADSLTAGGRFGPAVSDAAAVLESITSVHVVTHTHRYTETLTDAATPSDGLDEGGTFTAGLADVVVVSDVPLLAHLGHAPRHGYSTRDILTASERMSAHEPRPLNLGALDTRPLN